MTILLSLLLAIPHVSAQSLSFPEDTLKVFHDTSNIEYLSQEGNGESADNAPIFYIPIASGSNGIYETEENMSASLITGNVARSTLVIPVDVNISDSGETWDTFIAARKDNSEQYQVIHNRAGVTDGQSLDLTPDLNDICNVDNDLAFDCAKFRTGEAEQEEITLFMGVGIQGEVDHTGSVDSIDPQEYPDGHYFKLKLSSEINTAAPSLQGIYKGEGQLKITFQGEEISDVDSLWAYIQDLGKIESDEECDSKDKSTPSSYQALSEEGEHKKLNVNARTGKVSVKNLKNRHCYSVQIYYRNKYGFATGISDGLNAAPESLLKLLKENSCFLLTAGFKGNDPVIDDFRHFRDHILKRSPAGRAFIRLYYRYAPSYAPLVAASPMLSGLIRSAAYTLHWLFLKNNHLQ